jgi:hypothetical protein
MGKQAKAKSKTRDDELKAREMVFCLRYNWCLEEGLVKLLISRFAIPKADDILVAGIPKFTVTIGHHLLL